MSEAPTRRCARKGMVLAALALTAALFASAPGPASAQVLACGQVITQDTTLENDLTDCSGDGIVIGADGITLDLNGHTVEGSPCDTDCASNRGIDNTAGYDGVRILDGTIRGFAYSVALAGADENTLHALTVGGFPVARSFIGVSLSHSFDNELDRIAAFGGDPGGASVRLGREHDLPQLARRWSEHPCGSLPRPGGRLGREPRRAQPVDRRGGAAVFDSTGNRLVRNDLGGEGDAVGLAVLVAR